MGYGALSAADYFDVNAGDANPNVYAFKWGRVGWGGTSGAPAYTSTKPIGALPIATPGPYSLPTYSSVWNSCTIPETVKANITATQAAALVRCVGNSVMQAADGGQWWISPLWGATSDALYRPIDIRDTVPSGEYIYNNSSAPYSFQNPLKSLFSSTGGYANLQTLDPAFTGGGQYYYFYNRTQHTGTFAAMGARMLGYSAKAQRYGLPMWNSTVSQEKWPGNSYSLLTAQPTGGMYKGQISTSHPGGAGATLNLAPTITSGPSVMGNAYALNSAIIKWDTDYPSTTMIDDKDTSNDTVLNTSHSATLSGLSIGTYNYNAISYDCVANKVQSSGTFIFANMNISPTTLNLGSQGNYVTVVLKGYDTTTTNIDTSSSDPNTCKLLLNGSLCAVSASSTASSVTVKFDRAAVGILVGVPGTYVMTISARTTDATPIPIVGSSIMNVIQ